LLAQDVPILSSLPCIESEEETQLRSAEELGIRIVCLACAVGTAFEKNDLFKEYLRQHNLWDNLTPDEMKFLSNPTPDLTTIVRFTWRSEALFVLMWAVHLFDDLPFPRQETDTQEIVARLPDLNESPWPYIHKIKLRSIGDILEASDLIYRLHWATRQAGLDNKTPPSGLNPGMVQEWHHAINWTTKYNNQDWDEVSTDT